MTSARGPLPKFDDVYLEIALRLISRHGRVGRKHLAKELGIGEGSVRTIIRKLKEKGLISSARGGHFLTAAGRKRLEKEIFVEVDARELSVGKVSVATVVRGGSKFVKSGIEQRDEAIKVGADGATVLLCRKGELVFPGDFVKVNSQIAKELMKILRPKDGDVVIIGSGKNSIMAEAGTRAAAKSLSSKLATTQA